MASKHITTSQYVQLAQTPASVGDRIFARIIDLAVLMAYTIGIGIIIGATSPSISGELEMVMTLLLLLPLLGYTFLCELLFGGRTLGKMALKTRVTMADGSSPSIGALLMRWVFEMVDITMGLVGLLFIAFTRHHQRIGDLAAGTIVIKQPFVSSRQLTLGSFGTFTEDYRPRYPEAQRLTNGQADVIERLLYGPATYSDAQVLMLANKVERTLNIRPQAPTPALFLNDVLRDYQYFAQQLV